MKKRIFNKYLEIKLNKQYLNFRLRLYFFLIRYQKYFLLLDIINIKFLRHIINLQEEIKTLDSQAQQLYEIFVRKINIDINDSTEAQNVINIVSILP